MSSYPDDCKYTKDHEWIRDDGGVYAVGITQYAADQLGDVTYVELPEIDAEFKKGGAVGAVESVKAASDIYCPVAGRVSEINDDLEGQPELVNTSPYDEGWFFRLVDVENAHLNALMNATAYAKYVEGLG